MNEMPQAVIAGFAPAMVPGACARLVLAGFPSPGVCAAKTTATATTAPPALTAALFLNGCRSDSSRTGCTLYGEAGSTPITVSPASNTVCAGVIGDLHILTGLTWGHQPSASMLETVPPSAA